MSNQTRAEEIRTALDNLHFSRKFYFGVLAELEQLGRGFGPDYKRAEANIRAINKNITRLEDELEKLEAKEYEKEMHNYTFFGVGARY